jgi:hypothetical protein
MQGILRGTRVVSSASELKCTISFGKRKFGRRHVTRKQNGNKLKPNGKLVRISSSETTINNGEWKYESHMKRLNLANVMTSCTQTRQARLVGGNSEICDEKLDFSWSSSGMRSRLAVDQHVGR